MAGRGDWITEKCLRALDPERLSVALEGLAGVWPKDFPSLDEVCGTFPLGEEALLHLLSYSTVAAERLRADPAALLWLAQPEICTVTRGPRRMRAHLAELALPGSDPRFCALRRCKGREMLRIALRELAGEATLEQTTGELSDLAEVCVREVLAGLESELRKRWGDPGTGFCVLAMGKFGARELNYSSDIDLVFFYGEAGMVNASFTRHQYFATLAVRIVATFSAVEDAGPLFRIDMRLRPEGGTGELVRSLSSMENYYAGFGETWERMALIKARCVAGDEELGYELLQHLQPFIFPKNVSAEMVREIGRVKARIEDEILKPGELHRNVKLGYGGIREIEFTAQTLQMLHGARNAFLQDKSTIKILRGLSQLSLLSAEESERLAEVYRFLRTVEHRLQIEGEQQTHLLPTDPDALDRIARSLGYAEAAAMESELRKGTAFVRTVFNRILRGGAEKESAPADTRFFEDPKRAEVLLAELGGGSASVHVAPRTRQLFEKLQPLLLGELRGVAQPDAALVRFAQFIGAYGIRGMLFETLVTHPRLLELLVRLFDASELMTEVVLRRPQLIEEVVRGRNLSEKVPVARHLEELADNAERLEQMDWVRAYRRSQILRICLRDVLGLAGIEEVQEEYSALAEACVLFCMRVLGIEESVTVIAMGKFGGRELGYGSDLDLVFVGEQSGPAEQLVKVLQTKTAEGIIFPVDVRLRPEGAAGPLTSSLSGFAKYFQGRAQVWEAQALTKARALSGCDAAEFMGLSGAFWSATGERADLFGEVRAMHSKVVQGRAGGDGVLEFKTGRGGLMEAEFLAQALQMKHGVREPNTVGALRALGGCGALSAEDVERVVEGYLFLRRCESVLRRQRLSSVSSFPQSAVERRRLALRAGLASEEELMTRSKEYREGIHGVFEKALAI